MLRRALDNHEGDKRAAARAMGLALSTLYAKLKRHQL
jgi:transcriptional regulator of acetoin/glycerol metabolism